MSFSDSDLLMMENLTSMRGDDNPVSKYHLKNLNNCKTIGEFLNQFNEDILKKMDRDTSKVYRNGMIGSTEWAAMIRYMKKNKDMCALKVKGQSALGLVFEDPKNSNHAYVFFAGTQIHEWGDNIEGLHEADTEEQKNALRWINEIPYGQVTVIGHSKGGNKAQYVTVLSDKVDKCVSIDGQGFSDLFLQKYKDRIKKNAYKITCYSLSTDFVHPLLYPIPGVEPVYIKPGKDVKSIGENHSPNSVFDYDKKNGKNDIKIDKNGKPVLNIGEEDPSIKMFHGSINFIMNNASYADKEKIINFLVPLIEGLFGGMTTGEIIQYLLEHEDDLALVMAYLLEYMEANNLTIKDLEALCKTLGFDIEEVVSGYIEKKFHIKVDKKVAKMILGIILGSKKGRLLIGLLIALLGSTVGRAIGSWWQKVDAKRKKIDSSNGSGNYSAIKRDYSQNAYNTIMDLIAGIGANTFPNVSSWGAYSSEEWFSKINVSGAMQKINLYENKMNSVNLTCINRIEDAFSKILSIDVKYGEKINDISLGLKVLKDL